MTAQGRSAPFPGASEMHARVNAFDWSATTVGPIEAWPQSLRATITTVLGSRYPMILLWGSDLIQIYNEAYIGLIGDKHPDALGRSIRETQAESWDAIGPMIHDVMSTGIPNWVPAQRLPLERAGYREESYFSLSYSAVEDDERQVDGMLCVCSEVTHQVLGERRLRLLRDLAMKAGETRSVESTCSDVAGAIASHPLDVPMALLYLRDEPDEPLTLRATVGVERDDFDLDAEESDAWPLARAAAGETIVVDDLPRRVRVSGGPFEEPVRSALAMPISSSGTSAPLGVLVAGVSPNRALDESYRSFYELLVGQVSVAIRNAKAYEDERRRAEMLAEIDKAKTTFFNNVSHEFRTPLTLILGPLEDALADKEQPPPPRQRERLELIRRNSLRLFRLVNTLLDFSRVEAGRINAIYQPTDLVSLTKDLASLFRSAIERAGLTLDVEGVPFSAPVYVAREMWEKIVLNLVSNAVKHTFEGGIFISLHEEKGRARLRVEDTGTGIPDEELAHLFERFHRVEGARSRSHEGSGIGLALVQDLVKLHGGEVSVESALGRGSVFTVWVPLGTSHLPQDRIAAEGAERSSATTAAPFVEEAMRWLPGDGASDDEARGGELPARELRQEVDAALPSAPSRHRILLADDNADLRAYVADLLRPHFQVEAVSDGAAALEAALARRPDLVLSDVMMPRLDGFALLRELRADARTRDIPVILLSARAGEESTIEGLEAGADDYLAKPFSARELHARVRTRLEILEMRRNAIRQEEAVRARDQFLSIASHELKTPLTPLQVQVQTIRRHLPDKARDGAAEAWLEKRLLNVYRHSERLARLVGEILDVSNLLGGPLELDLDSVDLAEVVQDVAAGFEARGEVNDGCELRVRAERPVVGRWDRRRLEHIATHLLSNAIRYGERKPVDIAVEKRAEQATLVVSDRGVAIAPEVQQRLFGSLEEAVDGRDQGGGGLGLFVTRAFVEAMGGTIEVKSQSPAGSAFIVSLPLSGVTSSAEANGAASP